jgi:DNA-directed RNA polymerase subunit omega
MAYMSIEDCIHKTGNRFDMVLMATHRARLLTAGAEALLPRNNNKNTVIALREIAESMLRPVDLRESFIHSLQKQVELDEPDEEAAPAAFDGVSVVRPNASAEPQSHPMTEDELLRGLDALGAPPEHDEDE